MHQTCIRVLKADASVKSTHAIRCHKQNDSPNRNDLSSFLKVINDVEVDRRAGGKLFHARGPATANARSPTIMQLSEQL